MSFIDGVTSSCYNEAEMGVGSRRNEGRLPSMTLRSGVERRWPGGRRLLSVSSASASSDVASLEGVRGEERSSRGYQSLPQFYRGNHGEVGIQPPSLKETGLECDRLIVRDRCTKTLGVTTRPLARLFAHIAHSFACSALHIFLLALLLTSELVGK